MDKQAAITKIKKLLALSKSSNIYEAQDALLQAQKLMVKYYIDESELKDKKDANKKVVTISIINNKARLMWYEKALANIIADNFRVFNYTSGNRKNGMSIIFMGLEEDTEIAQELFSFAYEKMKSLASKEIKHLEQKEENKYKSSFRNDYYRGFIDGLNEAFKKQVSENGWGLVLVKDELVVQEINKLNLRTVKPTGIPPKFSNNKSLYNEGFDKGKQFGSAFNDGKSLDENPIY